MLGKLSSWRCTSATWPPRSSCARPARAGTVPELHALLLAQAGGGIDKKRLAKQLRAIAKLPL